MTADMLDEGAAGKDALALADAVDFLGATLGAGASWDASTVRLHVPVARLDDALALMADVALRPDFPEAELERLRKEALTDLLQARDEPRRHRLARARAGRVRTGAPLRHGRRRATPRRSRRSRSRDLRAFHAARYAPGGARRSSSWAT